MLVGPVRRAQRGCHECELARPLAAAITAAWIEWVQAQAAKQEEQ
jgi:hypothetical protein